MIDESSFNLARELETHLQTPHRWVYKKKEEAIFLMFHNRVIIYVTVEAFSLDISCMIAS